jgi:hypothetical protein
MGLVITLAGQRGIPDRTVMDPTRRLNELLPEAGDRAFRCLGFVDEYGTAVFNRLQMPDLISELERVRVRADAGQVALISQLLEMARACEDEPEHYVTFVGD